MNPKSKKLISLFLIFSLIMLSTNLYAKERRGATLIITKKDGQQIRGELITVKPNSLLLLDTEGKDVSVGISDIKVIRILRKSKVWTGVGYGLLIGGGVGALLGFAGGGQTHTSTLGWGTHTYQNTAGEEALGYGIVLGAIGLLIGGTLGFAVGTDKTILVEGKSQRWIEFYLEILRKKARIPDYK